MGIDKKQDEAGPGTDIYKSIKKSRLFGIKTKARQMNDALDDDEKTESEEILKGDLYQLAITDLQFPGYGMLESMKPDLKNLEVGGGVFVNLTSQVEEAEKLAKRNFEIKNKRKSN